MFLKYSFISLYSVYHNRLKTKILNQKFQQFTWRHHNSNSGLYNIRYLLIYINIRCICHIFDNRFEIYTRENNNGELSWLQVSSTILFIIFVPTICSWFVKSTVQLPIRPGRCAESVIIRCGKWAARYCLWSLWRQNW